MTTDVRALAERIARLYEGGATEPLFHGDALALARYALDREAGWQPIATAPKDGTRVLVIEGTHGAAAAWEEDFGQWMVHVSKHRGDGVSIQPSHWMPLPTPPRGAETGDDDGR